MCACVGDAHGVVACDGEPVFAVRCRCTYVLSGAHVMHLCICLV